MSNGVPGICAGLHEGSTDCAAEVRCLQGASQGGGHSAVAEACHTEGEGGSGVVGVFGGSQICGSYAAIPAAEEVLAPWREAIGCYNGGLDCEGSDVSGSVRRCVA